MFHIDLKIQEQDWCEWFYLSVRGLCAFPYSKSLLQKQFFGACPVFDELLEESKYQQQKTCLSVNTDCMKITSNCVI